MAKHFALTTIITFLILPTQMYGMDQNPDNELIKKIIPIACAHSLKFLSNNELIITDRHGSRIINLLTDEEIPYTPKSKEINHALQPALDNFKNITKNHPDIDEESIKYNAQKNRLIFLTCRSDVAAIDPGNLYIYNTTDDSCVLNIDKFYLYPDPQCSPDLSSIIFQNLPYNSPKSKAFAVNTKSGTITTFIETDVLCNRIIMNFQKNNAFLVTFTSSKCLIQYWNTKTYTCLAQTSIPFRLAINNMSYNSSCSLSISPDNRLLAIHTLKECLILEIPFETIGKNPYPLDIKQTMLFLFCTLNHYQYNNTPLPKEIVQLIAKKTLKTLKLRTGLRHG